MRPVSGIMCLIQMSDDYDDKNDTRRTSK